MECFLSKAGGPSGRVMLAERTMAVKIQTETKGLKSSLSRFGCEMSPQRDHGLKSWL